MRTVSTALLTAAAWLVASPAADVRAQPHLIDQASRVWITGSSNIRRFTCRAREVSGAVDLRATTTRSSGFSGENVAASPSVSIPVVRLDCGIARMSRHLHETLRVAEHPAIEFRLAHYDIDFGGEEPIAHLVGRLTIAGVEQPVELTADVRADSMGIPHVQGAHAVRMTSFGVRPPRRFAGLLRVRDRITVHFDIALTCDAASIDLPGLAGARRTPPPTDHRSCQEWTYDAHL